MTRREVLQGIEAERTYQERKWGSEFDTKNTINDWVAYLVKYTGNAISAAGTAPNTQNVEEFRKQIMKVATLCSAILEQADYAPRHYDSTERVG